MKHFFSKKGTQAVLVGVFVLIILLVTAKDIGLTWDEPAYIAAARSYTGWYHEFFTHPGQALSNEVISQYWSANHEHPPLDKIWSAFVFSIVNPFTDDLTAHRVGNMILSAILFGMVFYLMAREFGYLVGYVSVGALFTMPRFFFHAHLSALDVPATFSFFAMIFFFWLTLEKKNWKWGLFLGLMWGLALSIKINVIFIPVVIGIWWLIFRREMRIFWRVAIMGFSAIPVFWFTWPWLYHNTIDRFVEYILFITVNHHQIGQYYLGRFYMPPPWHFAFVMLWAVVPLGLTILYFTGIFRVAKSGKHNQLGWLLIISALVPLLALAIGQSMVYDNDRLFMASFPFLACLAGLGFGWLVELWNGFAEKYKNQYVKPVGIVILILLAFLPQIIVGAKLYPHLLSYFGEGVGGLRGATKMGLETTYWCETYSMAIPFINEQAEEGDRIWVDLYSHDTLIYMQMEGLLRDDVKILSPYPQVSEFGENAPQPVALPLQKADWFIVQYRQTALGSETWDNPELNFLFDQEIVFEYSFDGVPIMILYKATK
jgi:4-amino-4-deoxy-L-arabinose transferase-like glycosyltransferase